MQRFSRRHMLKLGVAGTGYLILGPNGQVSFADDVVLPPSPKTTPFIDELPLPGVALSSDPFLDLPQEYLERWVDANTQFVKIVTEQRWVKFHSELPLTAIWGYRDLSPFALPSTGAGSGEPLPYNILGPTLVQLFGENRAPYVYPTPGQTASLGPFPIGGGLVVRQINCLPKDHRGFGVPRTTVHLHGGHHLSRADGFPESIENRPGNNGNPDILDGFPCHIVMEPPGFVPPADEPPCSSPAPPVHELCPADNPADTRLVTERQVLDYYYPVLDPGVLDILDGRASGPTPGPDERPSTQWYHDHLLDFTGPNVYRGLAGLVLCFDEIDSGDEEDPGPKALRLPSAPYDIPLVLQDKQFAADGSLLFNSFDHDGFLGDKFLVNGAIQPFLEVKRRKYRFRLLNAANARIYQIFLNDGKPASIGGRTFLMDLIATEGGLLSYPLRGVVSLMLSMAQRLEVVIDFSKFDTGTELFLENRLFQNDGRKPEDDVLRQGAGNKMLKFIVGGDPPAPDNSQVPDVLRPFEPISAEERARARRRTFRFDRSHGAWTINGELAGNLEKPVATPQLGQPEIWRLENNSGGWWHPIHIHSEFFRVLSRNGRVPSVTARNPVVAERDGVAKRDMILLKGNESVEVFLKFRDHLGPFTFHCHNMEHEDMAMMARFDVVP